MFELILAIALSATLLALIGTAINLYLMRVDAGRTRVEEAQLARSILSMIADDVRAASIYESQDTSAIAALIASSRPADEDDDDDDDDSDDAPGTEGTGGAGSSGAPSTISGSAFSSDGGNSSSSSSSNPDSSEQADDAWLLGLSGTLAELYIDVTRLPRRDELFATITGYTNVPMPTTGAATGATAAAAVLPPCDLKTVRYFIRQGEQVGPGRTATMSLSPEQQQRAGGLVRQAIPRATRTFAEQTGNSAMLESGQVLIAPEVVHLEFRYYDGRQVSDVWDMQEERSLPQCIEVRIWLAPPQSAGEAGDSEYDLASLIGSAREYRQTVYLPMSAVYAAAAGGNMPAASSTNSSPP